MSFDRQPPTPVQPRPSESESFQVEPPAEFVKELERLRTFFENQEVQNNYQTLTPEELQEVARLVWWLKNGIDKYWVIHGKPMGLKKAQPLGWRDYHEMPVEGVQMDLDFFKSYIRGVDTVFSRESGNRDLIGFSREYSGIENGLDVLIGPGKRDDATGKGYTGVAIQVRNPGGRTSSQIGLDGEETRGVTYSHRFLIDAYSPLFQWLSTTDNLRPLTFALREAVMAFDHTNKNAQTGYLNRELIDATFEPWNARAAFNERAVIVDLGGIKGTTGQVIIHSVPKVNAADGSRNTKLKKFETTSHEALRAALKAERVHCSSFGNAFVADTIG